jgi:hypothetical protein
MPLLSILDLAFVPEGGTAADALRNTRDLTQHAEKWGYRRFWMALCADRGLVRLSMVGRRI